MKPTEPPAQPASAAQSVLETQKLVHELQAHQIELERQNDELRKSQADTETALARYTNLYDFGPIGYFMLGPDGKIAGANLVGARLLGMERARLTGKRFGAFVSEADLPVFNGLLQQVFVSEISQTCEVDLVSQGGLPPRSVQIEATLSPGEPDCRVVVMDITARKQAELREATHSRTMTALAGGAPLAEVLATLVRGVEAEYPGTLGSVLLLDAAGTHLLTGAAPSLPAFYNEAIHGVAIGPAVGSCGTAAFTGERVLVADIQTDPRWTAFKALAAQAGLASCWSEPIRGTRGQVVGTFALYYAQPRVPSEAEIASIVASAQLAVVAIERKQAEAGQARLTAILEATPDFVGTADALGAVVYLNPAGRRMTGHGEREDVTRLRTSDLSPDWANKIIVEQGLPTAVRDGSWSGETAFKGADGQDILVSQIIISHHDTGGVGRWFSTIARDITARTELEERLREAQKMDAVGRLAAGVAHDFNNLLTVILGNCEVALPLLAAADPVGTALRDIRTSAERAAGLTKQLLAFSRRQIIQPRVVDVNQTVSAIFLMVKRLIGEHIAVHFQLDPGLWHVSVDPGQLEQVLVNLSVNARDAMPDGGRLTIETRNVRFEPGHIESGADLPAGEFVQIVMADTGVGMDAATRARAFEPFFTTKEPGKGTGLGLAMVYGVIKQSGGFVFVDSVRDEGSTFSILLPRIDALVPVPTAEAPGQQSTAGHELVLRVETAGTELVLLVEDEDDLRELVHEYLQSQGYAVVSASTGEEGLERFRSLPGRPALLISDIVMPGINGRVLSDQLRVIYPQLKVLYISGYTDDALVRYSPLPKDMHFLQKPFALAALATEIRDILDEDVER